MSVFNGFWSQKMMILGINNCFLDKSEKRRSLYKSCWGIDLYAVIRGVKREIIIKKGKVRTLEIGNWMKSQV
jgi:hypothetical protein